jgi:hypothetical protein
MRTPDGRTSRRCVMMTALAFALLRLSASCSDYGRQQEEFQDGNTGYDMGVRAGWLPLERPVFVVVRADAVCVCPCRVCVQ